MKGAVCSVLAASRPTRLGCKLTSPDTTATTPLLPQAPMTRSGAPQSRRRLASPSVPQRRCASRAWPASRHLSTSPPGRDALAALDCRVAAAGSRALVGPPTRAWGQLPRQSRRRRQLWQQAVVAVAVAPQPDALAQAPRAPGHPWQALGQGPPMARHPAAQRSLLACGSDRRQWPLQQQRQRQRTQPWSRRSCWRPRLPPS